MKQKIPVAILGSGIIGTDLLYKIQRSANMECSCFVGRRNESEGIIRAKRMGVTVSCGGAEYLLANPDIFAAVFDATNAEAHREHSPAFSALGKMVFDLTPAHLGKPVVPTINSDDLFSGNNISLVSCGGQASLPVLHAISKACDTIEYIEMVNTGASKSAGLGTRRNIDEYLETTEAAITEFTGCANVKCLTLINPADPPVHMRVAITVLTERYDVNRVDRAIMEMMAKVKRYVPGYALITDPIYGKGKITLLLRVSGKGDYLEAYAGNLDIINAAAVQLGDIYSGSLLRSKRAQEQRGNSNA